MRFYLSSYMIGDYPERLLKGAGGPGARMAIITNALDYIPLDEQIACARTRFDALTYFADYGFDPSLIDLRPYFGREQALKDVLAKHRVIWALGGNAFLLRRAMRESGFDEMINGLLDEGHIYSGWSAGACVAGKTLRPIGLMDNPEQTALGYPVSEPIWEGLGLVPYAIIPHVESDHPEARSAGTAVDWAKANGIDYLGLQDGEVIIGDGSQPQRLEKTQ